MAALSKLTSREAVEHAMREFDRVGRSAFLGKYGFGRSRDYYIRFQGRDYDSKAIVGVAYGLQFPNEGVLRNTDFSGGAQTVKAVLSKLGFPVVPNPYRFLVLAENEVHARAEFSKWQDVTGERYHFPNIYRNKVVPGREFVYYIGGRRKGGRRSTPEYFGWGRIGAVYPDPSTSELPKSKWHWLCDIDDYREFANPVGFMDNDGLYRELGSNVAPVRYWEAGVREITDLRFRQILAAAGITLGGDEEGVVPPQEITVLGDGLELLVRTKSHNVDAEAGSTTYPPRRSGRAKVVGDAGEKIVLDWLRAQARNDADKQRIVWVAEEGETPGWDIEDRRGKQAVVYEVKATNGKKFPAIEVTANEWGAAARLRQRYNLAIVSECEGPNPKVQLINDPWGLFEQATLRAIPTLYRLTRA